MVTAAESAIDISAWDTDPAARAVIAAQVGAAAARTGLLQVTGHGIPGRIHDGLREAIDLFFERPAAAKLRYLPPDPDTERGYRPPGPARIPESFRIGTQARDFPERRLPEEGYPANIWPVGLPRFQPQVMAWFDAAQRLVRRLTRIFAVALELPEGFFEPYTGHSMDVLHLEYAPPRAAAPAPGRPLDGSARGTAAGGASAEPGLLRLVWAPGGGLEFADGRGVWHGFGAAQQTLVVHIGGLLARWTNDRWPSPPLRVAAADARPVRCRAAYLSHGGDFDALVTTLPTCVGPGRPDRYPPVTVAGHLAAEPGGDRWKRLIGAPL
ncbi:2-oxoglutarate and iron-dependent oxygenase domain-containing protein [Streptomonospora sediminis]